MVAKKEEEKEWVGGGVGMVGGVGLGLWEELGEDWRVGDIVGLMMRGWGREVWVLVEEKVVWEMVGGGYVKGEGWEKREGWYVWRLCNNVGRV